MTELLDLNVATTVSNRYSCLTATPQLATKKSKAETFPISHPFLPNTSDIFYSYLRSK